MTMEKIPEVAILRWEQGDVPAGLKQLGDITGNSTNPDSYPFPVKLVEVKGANVETVITHPSKKLLADMIEISKELIEKEGIRAITTSCGFNAIFQKPMADALSVPVFTSSLMQVPFVQQLIGAGKKVEVITANKGSLTEEHFRACGIGPEICPVVVGLEEAEEWSKIFDKPDESFDLEKVENEIITAALGGIEENPSVGAIVLECTDLPPFARKIGRATGLPVFDFSSMMGHIAISLGIVKLY